MIIEFLLEAETTDDEVREDPAQSLVKLHLRPGHVLFGHIVAASRTTVKFVQVAYFFARTPEEHRVGRATYPLYIGTEQIVAARYADLSEADQRVNGWT